MSIPVSKILKASKSIMAIADLNHNSPSTQNSQNVNVVINTPQPDKAVSYPDKVVEAEQNNSMNISDSNPYNEFNNKFAGNGVANGLPSTRDIEGAMKKTEEISESIDDKENTIKALSLIIDILQSNPLIVNKFVIAELETLQELIRLLTSSDKVEIDCNDIECSCTKVKYRTIKRIYITKDNELYNIQQCPVILKLFDNYKISLMFVI